MLASPIILEDHPRIAPESPGDLFDGGEIDQMLVLNILSLTDEEKAEMRDCDPRAREILERTEALTEDELMRLHGTIREFGSTRVSGEDPWEELERPGRTRWSVDGVELRAAAGCACDRGAAATSSTSRWPAAPRSSRASSRTWTAASSSRVVEDDPGRDLGERASPATASSSRPTRSSRCRRRARRRRRRQRVLVAGIGNVFLGDDGFGVEVAERSPSASCRRACEVVDFGIRGMDLAYALARLRRGGAARRHAARRSPGTLYVIEPDLRGPTTRSLDAHGMDP